MTLCPVCDFQNPEGAAACERCGLASDLFEPIRQAIGLPKSDERYSEQVRELMTALGDLAGPESEGPPPAPPSSVGGPATSPSPATSPEAGPGLPLPELPHRPPEPGTLEAQRRSIGAYLALAGRHDWDLAGLEERARELARIDDPGAPETLDRDLFVRLADRLNDWYRTSVVHRNELALYLPTPAIDVFLGEARSSLADGALDRTESALTEGTRLIEALDEEWGATLVLLGEARSLTDAIRSFGGDPARALGPIVEGERRVRKLERAPAESLLARGTLGLWSILDPLITKDLSTRVQEVGRLKAAGRPIGPVIRSLKEFSARVKTRDYAAALAAYREGGGLLKALADDGDRPVNSAPSVGPA